MYVGYVGGGGGLTAPVMPEVCKPTLLLSPLQSCLLTVSRVQPSGSEDKQTPASLRWRRGVSSVAMVAMASSELTWGGG